MGLGRNIGIGLSFVLLLLAALHIYYAAGGQWGQNIILGRSADPGPLAKLVVAALCVIGSAIVAARSNLLRLPVGRGVVRGMLYAMAAAFAAVSIDNVASVTTVERMVFAPVAAVLAVAAVLLAASPWPTTSRGDYK